MHTAHTLAAIADGEVSYTTPGALWIDRHLRSWLNPEAQAWTRPTGRATLRVERLNSTYRTELPQEAVFRVPGGARALAFRAYLPGGNSWRKPRLHQHLLQPATLWTPSYTSSAIPTELDLASFTLPMRTMRLRNMALGEIGYIVPWRLKMTRDFRFYIEADDFLYDAPFNAAVIGVQRVQGGLALHIPSRPTIADLFSIDPIEALPDDMPHLPIDTVNFAGDLQTLVRRRIRDLAPGETAHTVPWALTWAPDGTWHLDQDFTACRSGQEGTAQIRVTANGPGCYTVDIPAIPTGGSMFARWLNIRYGEPLRDDDVLLGEAPRCPVAITNILPRRASDLAVGEIGYIPPWLVRRDTDGQAYIDPGVTVYERRFGTCDTRLLRTAYGYAVRMPFGHMIHVDSEPCDTSSAPVIRVARTLDLEVTRRYVQDILAAI